jgi:hypothetical protein
LTDCDDPDCGSDPTCQQQTVCTDYTKETECLDAGCNWNRKKGCR